MKHYLGSGAIDWPRYAPMKYRYGTIVLREDSWPWNSVKLRKDANLDGKRGKLVGIVKQPKYYNDGINLSAEKTVIFGEGTLTFNEESCVSLKNRTGWIDPVQLCALHGCIVDLFFLEKAKRFFNFAYSPVTQSVSLFADNRELFIIASKETGQSFVVPLDQHLANKDGELHKLSSELASNIAEIFNTDADQRDVLQASITEEVARYDAKYALSSVNKIM